MMSYVSRHKARLLLSASTFAVLLAANTLAATSSAQAQTTAPSGQDAQSELEEVVITGSRIVRDGYEAPTPLSVVDAAALQSGGGTNIADQVNQMPVFANSSTPTSTTTSISAGTSGANALNQALQFHEAIGLTGLVITKLDGTAKGGALLAIAKRLSLPIRYIGVGEGAQDLEPFDAAAYVDALIAA